MRWRVRDRGAAEAVLRERVSQLESDLAFLRGKHDALLAEGDRPRRENAVLRFALQKCQRDRQVVEWHLGAARSELRMALALVRRYDASPQPHDRAVLEQAALLAHQARVAGVDGAAVEALTSAVAAGWLATFPGEARPGATDAVELTAARLVAALEARAGHADQPAAGGWLPDLRSALGALLGAAVGTDDGADRPLP